MSENKSESNLSQEKLLSGFLVFSLLLNLFLVFHANNLTGQVSILSNTISSLSQSLASGGKVQSTVTPTQTTSTPVSQGEILKVRLVTDKRCADCDTTGLIDSLKTNLGNPIIIEYDYSQATGKQLFELSGQKVLPVVLFENNITTSKYIDAVSRYLKPVGGDYLSLAIGANFDPTCYLENGSADCVKCTALKECRELKPKQVDLFVMSQCPYGVMAMDAMKDVLGTLKDIKFNLHYIADFDNSTGEFNSLHGPEEVKENIRELCVAKYYPTTYMNYIWCRNKDIKSTAWESCASSNSMDTSKITTCSTSREGRDLLMEDIKIAGELAVGASPTFYANNRYSFNAISAEDIKSGICSYNPTLTGCNVKLNATSAAPSGAGCAP